MTEGVRFTIIVDDQGVPVVRQVKAAFEELRQSVVQAAQDMACTTQQAGGAFKALSDQTKHETRENRTAIKACRTPWGAPHDADPHRPLRICHGPEPYKGERTYGVT